LDGVEGAAVLLDGRSANLCIARRSISARPFPWRSSLPKFLTERLREDDARRAPIDRRARECRGEIYRTLWREIDGQLQSAAVRRERAAAASGLARDLTASRGEKSSLILELFEVELREGGLVRLSEIFERCVDLL
jgi:hypothetical protein